MERGSQVIPHGHYTPEEWKHNSIHRSVDIADNGNCKCINTETEIASEGVCSSLEALRVKLGVLSPGHSACVMQGLNSRSRDGIGAAHVHILTIDHVLALEVDAGFHSLECQEVPYRPCNLYQSRSTLPDSRRSPRRRYQRCSL